MKAEVKYVDAQESYNGGVIVLVIGSMVNVDGSRRGFTQTFFLAPQDKGYYVLNDIFRYLEGDVCKSVKQDSDIAPATLNQSNALVYVSILLWFLLGVMFHVMYWLMNWIACCFM